MQTVKLSKSQRGYLMAVREKHNVALQGELSRAFLEVMIELGLEEEFKANKINVSLSQDYSEVRIEEPPKQSVTSQIPKGKKEHGGKD